MSRVTPSAQPVLNTLEIRLFGQAAARADGALEEAMAHPEALVAIGDEIGELVNLGYQMIVRTPSGVELPPRPPK